MSYGSPDRRRRKSGLALVISILIRVVLLAIVIGSLIFLVRGARQAFQAAVSTLQPSSGVSSDVGEPPAQSAPAQPDPAQSAVPPSQSAPPEEPAVPVVVEPRGIIVVDPGHGGRDPGCGEEGSLEKDVVLPIALMVREKLEAENVTVVMTREEDKGLTLDDRTLIANDAEADLFVSIHCNAFDGKASGLEVYYYKDETARDMAVDLTSRATQAGVKTREVRSQKYQVLWGTKMPAVLVETGFLTDKDECALLVTQEYQEKLAQVIADTMLAALDRVKAPLA